MSRDPADQRWWPTPFLAFSLLLHLLYPIALLVMPAHWLLLTVVLIADHSVVVASLLLPRCALSGPNLCRLPQPQGGVVLTFDDGPDPLTTPLLLDLLEKRKVKATFFVIGEKAVAHPVLIDRIIQNGHALGNHSFRHSTGVFFRTVSVVLKDIAATQKVLQKHGVEPLVYRPPVGIVSPRLWPALKKTGLTLVTFSNRPLDRGNRHLSNLASKVLQRLQDGDIVLLHDRRPPDIALIDTWLKDVAAVVDGIEKRGMRVVPLSDLIGMPVTKPFV
jgi:peptidoglycan/xylan/chitin deacetylase (PgdA/CDA1 family)